MASVINFQVSDTLVTDPNLLNRLCLSITEHILDNYLEFAKDRPFMEIFDHLLEQEVKNLKSTKVETRLNYSGLPFRNTLDRFDFYFPPPIDRKSIDDLMTLGFLHNTEYLVFLGPPGVRETIATQTSSWEQQVTQGEQIWLNGRNLMVIMTVFCRHSDNRN